MIHSRLISTLLILALTASAFAAVPPEAVMSRTSNQVAEFLDRFSQVKCTEVVTQEKLAPNGKTTDRIESTFDYLVILSNAGGELTLDESRLAQGSTEKRKKNTSLLLTNGFAMLFLVFHPYYEGSFEFSDRGVDLVDGRRTMKVAYRHIRGTRSPMALSLRGREYPVDLEGTAWIEAETGTLLRINAVIDSGMEDLGMKSLRSEVKFTPVTFPNIDQPWWLPNSATIDVETLKQHWRNTHHFDQYKKFSVSTQETTNGPK